LSLSKTVFVRINLKHFAKLKDRIALFSVEAAVGLGNRATGVDEKLAFAPATS
jgi:hypothetical protein